MASTMAPTSRQHRYRPRGALVDVFHDRSPELLVSGPAGTGKSRACLEKLLAVMLANAGARGLIVRKTQVSMTSTALVTWREFVATEAIEAGVCWYYGGSQEEPAQYRFANGSAVMLGGMDRPTKIMSSEYDMVYVQEAIELTETDWEHIITRLRHGRVTFQQLLADTNPDADTHWLHQRCNNGPTVRLESRHTDNPVLFADDGTLTVRGRAYMSVLDSLTGVRRRRLLDGAWVAAEGVIYEGYDKLVHLIDSFTPPDDWVRWWDVDFGYRNPFVLQRWAQDGDGRLYLYAERYLTGQLVEDHARAVLAEVAPEGTWVEPKPRAIICDHDAEDRATLERHLGRSTTAAHKAVKPGLEAVMARWTPAGDGRPRLFLMRDARTHPPDDMLVQAKLPTCTAEEIPSYVWLKGPDGKPVKEEPLKQNDHGCDAMRYQVAQVDLRGRPRMRWLQ